MAGLAGRQQVKEATMTPEAERVFEIIFVIVISIGLGSIMLLLGRKLFWLLGSLLVASISAGIVAFSIVGVIWMQTGGFQGGIDITQTPLSETPGYAAMIIAAAVIGGVVSAIFLRRLPRLVAGIIGFVAGIYMLLLAFELYGVAIHDALEALFAISAGVIVAIFAWRNHDTALIVLSTLAGANMIVTGLQFDLSTPVSAILWLVLMLTGIIFQSYLLYRDRAKQRAKLQVKASVGQTGAVIKPAG
jgi:hypothetical protein